jgi:hypothetical protein
LIGYYAKNLTDLQLEIAPRKIAEIDMELQYIKEWEDEQRDSYRQTDTLMEQRLNERRSYLSGLRDWLSYKLPSGE